MYTHIYNYVYFETTHVWGMFMHLNNTCGLINGCEDKDKKGKGKGKYCY